MAVLLPPNGAEGLSEFIWNDLAKDPSGMPILIPNKDMAQGTFFDANSEYTLLHTSNNWMGDALHASGLPISGNDVIFSVDVMSRVQNLADAQCTVAF